jgi:hypothetical protein
MKRLDAFSRLLGQTQILLERLKVDANSLRVDLSELQSLADHLGRHNARLSDICRLTEKRSELTADVLNANEKRIEPLAVVRCVGKQLQTLIESARDSVDALRSPAARSHAWKIGRRLLRWTPIAGALVALGLLGIIIVGTRDQPAQIATIVPAAHRESPVSVPVSLPPGETSRLAMFVMPASLAAGLTRTIPPNQVSSVDGPGPARATRAVLTAGASQPGGSAKETVQYVGVLAVDSEPTGSVVFVDRQPVGETPLQLTRVRAGSHVVRIERDGYDRWTTAALVAADKQTHVRAKLQAVRDR